MTDPDDVDLSVVIPSARDTPEALIESLLTQATNGDELILVKDTAWHEGNWSLGATPAETHSGATGRQNSTETIGWAAAEQLRVEHTHGGAAVARNTGWRSATNERILFLDDDIEVRTGFLEAVRRSASRTPESNVVGFRIVSPPPETDWERMGEETLTLDRGEQRRTSDGTAVRIQDVWLYGSGGAFVATRSVLEATNGFKDYLGAGRPYGGIADIEFLWHASHHGTISYDGDVSVRHPHPGTQNDWANKLIDYGRGLGFLAGAIETDDSRTHALGYCSFIREALETTAFSTLSDRNQRLAKRSIDVAVTETIRTLTFAWGSVSMTTPCSQDCAGGTE